MQAIYPGAKRQRGDPVGWDGASAKAPQNGLKWGCGSCFSLLLDEIGCGKLILARGEEHGSNVTSQRLVTFSRKAILTDYTLVTKKRNHSFHRLRFAGLLD
jgi:hypothetical protein